MDSQLLNSPVIQYGFAGFSFILVGIIVWLISKLLTLLTKTNEIIARNTKAIESIGRETSDLLFLNREIHDKLLSRPCIAQKEQ